MEAAMKAILSAVVVGGMLIASFYMAYVLILLLVLTAVGGLAYSWFNRDEIFSKPFLDD